MPFVPPVIVISISIETGFNGENNTVEHECGSHCQHNHARHFRFPAPVIFYNHHGNIVCLGFVLCELSDLFHNPRKYIADRQILEPAQFIRKSFFGEEFLITVNGLGNAVGIDEDDISLV